VTFNFWWGLKILKNSIYYPFMNIPYLSIRHVWMQDSFIADELYKLISCLR